MAAPPLARTGNDSILGGWGRGSRVTTRALSARCFKGARLSTLVSACLREDKKTTATNKSSHKTYDKEVRSRGTYILERTWAFFIGRPDWPCSGAVRFEPANSGAALLRSTASTTTARSPACSGADPPGLRDSWGWTVAPAADEGHVDIPGPTARISNDCKHRVAALGSATGGAVGVDAESDDFPRDRRLCRESESGRSEPS
jgi:hypothetical protein